MSLIEEKEIVRVIFDRPERLKDKIIKEVAFTLKINEKEIVNLICTPEYIEDLAVGYIYSQGLIKNIHQIEALEILESNTIDMILRNFTVQKLQKEITTSGERSLKYVDENYKTLESNHSNEVITPNQIYDLTNRLFDASTLHSETGGVHNAALYSFDGQFFEFRKDIGRHNAADKLIGFCLNNEILLTDKILIFSGRISSEIIKKVAMANIPMIISVSAPTDLAVEIAKELNITLVGFVRGKKMNIYNDCGRINIKW